MELEQQLKEMLIERLFLSLSPDEIENDKNLMENYDIDSISVMEMAVGLEEEFGIQADGSSFQLSNFSSIDNMAAYVRQHQS